MSKNQAIEKLADKLMEAHPGVDRWTALETAAITLDPTYSDCGPVAEDANEQAVRTAKRIIKVLDEEEAKRKADVLTGAAD